MLFSGESGVPERGTVGVRIVTDSGCDLPESIVESLGIEVVPLTIRFGDEELIDRKELGNEEFWRRLQTTPTLPETAAPSPGAFEQRYRGLIADGATAIVCINMSSELSGTMQAAQVAATAMAGECLVEVIDSRSCSMGLGALCVSAAEQAAAGASLDEVVADVIDRRGRTRLFATLDTLEFLKRGGRVGNAQALLGSMLSIKPIIEVRNGTVEDAGKVRTRSRALQAIVDRVLQQSIDQVSLLQGDAPDFDVVLDRLAELVPRNQIIIGEVGPVIGTHAGPGVVGVTFQVS